MGRRFSSRRLAVVAVLVCLSFIGSMARLASVHRDGNREKESVEIRKDTLGTMTLEDSLDVFVDRLLEYFRNEDNSSQQSYEED